MSGVSLVVGVVDDEDVLAALFGFALDRQSALQPSPDRADVLARRMLVAPHESGPGKHGVFSLDRPDRQRA
jgi:hypothetical protein